jgi:hypothetical protein
MHPETGQLLRQSSDRTPQDVRGIAPEDAGCLYGCLSLFILKPVAQEIAGGVKSAGRVIPRIEVPGSRSGTRPRRVIFPQGPV